MPLLELWGRIAFGIGLVLAVVAYGGFTFRPGGSWGFGRERQAWDARAVLSVPVTFVLTTVTGYLGSFVVLVPGAQTFESLKDLVVFLCIVLFGYPALLTVPFAYGLSDLVEGVPPELLFAWLPGYFINPACFWLAYQLIGRDPDFRRATTWAGYAVFVVAFTALEPILWGYISSATFGAEVSYRAITSALLFTTAITWLLAPFAMLVALPAVRRLGLFWAEIPDHLEERVWREVAWSRGGGRTAFGTAGADAIGAAAGAAVHPAFDPAVNPTVDGRRGWPIRMILAGPFVLLVMVMVGVTAYVTLRSAHQDAELLAARLHVESSENIRLRLDARLTNAEGGAAEPATISALLSTLPVAESGIALVLSGTGRIIGSSAPEDEPVVVAAAERARAALDDGSIGSGAPFQITMVTERPLARTNWLGWATPYAAPGRPDDWVVVTLMPDSYYLAGVQVGSRRSALVFALASLLSLALGAGLASRVTRRLREITDATEALAAGRRSAGVPDSGVVELAALGRSFNEMAGRLEGTIRDLGERETFLRMTQEAARVGSWEWDLGGPLERIRWSEQLATMHGIASTDFDGAPDTVLALCHPQDRPHLDGVMRRIRSGEDPGPFEYRVRTRDGATRHLWFIGQVDNDERGQATRVLGIAVDITERKQLESLLTAEARMLALIAGDAPLQEVLAEACKTFEALRPGTLASVLLLGDDGAHVRHGAAPSLPAAYWAAIDGAPIGPKAGSCGTAAHRGQAVIVVDIDVDPLWDDYRPLAQAHGLRACWSTPITDSAGSVLGTFAMYYREPRSPSAEDLRLIARATRIAGIAIQRKKAQDALRANEDRLMQEKHFVDTLMNSLPGVVILFDALGRLVKWNAVLERVTGYSDFDLAAMSAIDLVAPTDAEAVAAAVRAARDGGQQSVEAHLVTRDGRAIPYYFTGVRLTMEAGPHTLGIGIDISDRRRLEEQFQQAQKMEAMGHLAAGVAHDFNNLLTVISGSAEVLDMDESTTPAQRESVSAIRNAGKRAAALTRQLLSFSRKSVLQPRILDLNAEVGETQKMLRRVLGEDVSLTTGLEPNLRSIRVDPGQLSQILMNLSVNARDAMPQGGTLSVSTRNAEIDAAYSTLHASATPGSYVVLSVADTGTGMPPEVLPRIFEPFFTTKGVGKGTGLGLAMVYGVVTQSGGHIDVRSEVGRGTTFDIYFPAVDAAPGDSEALRGSVANQKGSETILLVEDDPDVRGLSLHALRSHGYTVLLANDGHDALRISEGHGGPIDLVVTDVVMAGLGGRQTVELLRRSRPGLRVLFVSGYTDDAVVRHGVLNAEVEFLPKPFTPSELARKVREVLGAHTAVTR